MFKLLGIDYGESKVGLAIADSETKLAIPQEVVKSKDLEDKIVYYKWARQAYYTILKEMDMKIVYNKQFRGVKNNDLRKYEIIIFQK